MSYSSSIPSLTPSRQVPDRTGGRRLCKGLTCAFFFFLWTTHTHKSVVRFEASMTGAAVTGEDHSQFISGGIEAGGLAATECTEQALVSSRAIIHLNWVKPAILQPVGLKPGHKGAEERGRSSWVMGFEWAGYWSITQQWLPLLWDAVLISSSNQLLSGQIVTYPNSDPGSVGPLCCYVSHMRTRSPKLYCQQAPVSMQC